VAGVNMDFGRRAKTTACLCRRRSKTRVVENGPARVAIEVERETEDSKFVQTISLAAGDSGNRVEFRNVIDWKTKQANLKATFPLAATNNSPLTIGHRHGAETNAEERQFEVASHQWIDLTDQSGTYGATVLTDCKERF